ncbi:hypothetical protein BDV95DRAFT_108906 [Massariosphaeria phaeospora]|uniref:Uncharacterized protein n=1 Tax=Massariosphaeria phaeospora TaxID=100035 RepID=A0A7C8M8R7_9PLEO|nr:hypothetical protein BDV95DRAFT_108906 [Massariosphaeria phaeospora]
MSEKTVGWRKKIAKAARPKTPSLLRPLAVDDTNLPEDVGERRRRWRKTVQGSVPGTPTSAVSPVPPTEEDDDTRSERSETYTPRRRSAPRPKLARYLSGYLAIKDEAKEPNFLQPWSEDAPPVFVPLVDPLVVLQSIHSHLINDSSQAISAEHNSGVLRVLEDYKKVRREKERLDALLQDTIKGFEVAETVWSTTEERYQEEIRRLDLLVAHSTIGMAGLMKVRQQSVVDRKRVHRSTVTKPRSMAAFNFLSQDELDEQIHSISQKVLLHRPSSPSGKMTALSRQLSGLRYEEKTSVGAPPSSRQLTLSRKVKSELDLARIGNTNIPNSPSHSFYSGFSESGDPLPDEIGPSSVGILDSVVECEAFVALSNLGMLVARRKGLDVEKFQARLMSLFSTVEDDEMNAESEASLREANTVLPATVNSSEENSNWTPNRRVRRFHSHPLLCSDQRRRRHFSFEPGDDQPEALDGDSGSQQSTRPMFEDNSTSSELSLSPGLHIKTQDEVSSDDSKALTAEYQKPSKIPSPAQRPALGRVRREDSVSSLQSVSGRSCLDDRRASKSSVLTAYRNNSQESMRPQMNSRSNSTETQHHVDQVGGLSLRNSVVALAAARAAGQGDYSPGSKSSSSGKGGKKTSASSRKVRTSSGKARPENESRLAQL